MPLSTLRNPPSPHRGVAQILPRTANLEAASAPTGPPPEQDVPLAVPAKTRLYVEQTQVRGRGRVLQWQLLLADNQPSTGSSASATAQGSGGCRQCHLTSQRPTARGQPAASS
jgi:hypothetical protein